MHKISLSIVLPTFNEAGNICKLISQIRSVCRSLRLAYELIIVDDNSPDQTGLLVRRNFKNIKNIRVSIRTREKGLAQAVRTGIEKSHGQQILVMDTDFNHDPKEIIPLVKRSKKYQMVIGSRYVKHGGMENKVRHYLSLVFNLYLKLLLGHNINDNLSGFFIARRKDLATLNFDTIFFGFGDYFMRLVYEFYKQGRTISEIPVYYQNRPAGVSKSKFLSMFITYTYSAIKLRFGLT